MAQPLHVSASAEWRESTKKEVLNGLRNEFGKLLGQADEAARAGWLREFGGFEQLFERFQRQKPTIEWARIEPLPPDAIRSYGALATPEREQVRRQLAQLVVVKLNGGLGTSMGCRGPKSLIGVRDDLTFLDLTMQQIEDLNETYDVDVPLVLMNSFNTDEDTAKILRKYGHMRVTIHTFQQSRFPRIDRDTLMPVAQNLRDDDLEAWYPPGHGNFYEAFSNSGLLDKFIDDGRKFCFISNIDNMGATVDLNVLNFLLTDPQQPQFVMEVTDKTRADVKGGTLIKYDGKLRLLEIAQVPKDYQDEFRSVNRFRIFNTNNLWVNLDATKQLVSKNAMDMEVIVNPKHLDTGGDVIQLETAAGAAVKNFQGACGINVPRSRFLPVKKSQDLLLLMSNLYDMEKGRLTLSKLRSFPTTPLVKLGTSFDKVQDFQRRFRGCPDILELDHLTVSGDVTFGRDVTLKGTVIIIANHGDRIDIPIGAYLENKIVSGNLRILDH